MVIDNVIFCKNVFKHGCGVIVLNIDYNSIPVCQFGKWTSDKSCKYETAIFTCK